MAAKRRHWWEKNGRFWARISIPLALQPYFGGKTQLTEALGGDRRIADRTHAAAVARLQEQIEQARLALGPVRPTRKAEILLSPITPADFERAVSTHYTRTLQNDVQKRASMPTLQQMNSERERILQRVDACEIGAHLGIAGLINAYTDYELMLRARDDDGQNRARRLTALRSALASGDTRLIEPAVRLFLDSSRLAVDAHSPEWHDLAHHMLRAEIEALERTVERDRGNFSGQPTDPIVQTPANPAPAHEPVPLRALFDDYIATRQAVGKHRDGGAMSIGIESGPRIGTQKGPLGHPVADPRRRSFQAAQPARVSGRSGVTRAS